MAHERRTPRRPPASSSSSSPSSSSSSSGSASALPSMMRLLVVCIVLLGLCSISLQGYSVLKQRTAGGAAIQEDTTHLHRDAGQASLLRTAKEKGDAREDPHAEISALAGIEGDNATASPRPVYPDQCEDERDWGLVAKIRQSAQSFCEDSAAATDAATQVTYYNVTRGGFRAVVFRRQFGLDLSRAKLFKPIKSMAQDGGRHDPRFVFDPTIVRCACEPLHQFAVEQLVTHNRTLSIWDPLLAKVKKHTDPPATVCAAPPRPASGAHIEIHEKTLVIVRKDDHNPFFQISSALNAWILLHALDWKAADTRVIHLDGGYPSPIDELHRKLLSPNHAILRGIPEELLGRRLEFHDDVALVPYETTGPMMQHLNDFEPCRASKMLQQFRDEALSVMALPAPPAARAQITVTVITRRNYGGRRVQRTWRNEAQILARLRALYPTHEDLPVVFESIDFVGLSLQEQMHIMRKSDVVIGMHGAGMVNVFWTRPGTLVVEIFPKRRFRWGYRNLCQFLGCDWHQFRGGNDTGKGDNNSHKMIPWEEWEDFFLPLFEKVLERAAQEER